LGISDQRELILGWFTSARSLGFFVLSHPLGDQGPAGANPGVTLFILNPLSLTS